MRASLSLEERTFQEKLRSLYVPCPHKAESRVNYGTLDQIIRASPTE